MDNLSYPQPIKYWLHLCRHHRSRLFLIGTFLTGIGILVVLFHTNNGTAKAAADTPSSSATLLLPHSIQHEREKRQTNQHSHEELQRVPLPSLQHKQQSMSDLTVISTTTRTTTRSPSFTSIGNENVDTAAEAAEAAKAAEAADATVAAVDNDRWSSITKRGHNRKKKHQSIADRRQSNRPQQKANDSMLTSLNGTRNRQQKHDTVSNENKNRHQSYNRINNIENSASVGGSSHHRNHIPKINNNFSLRRNFTSHFKVHAFVRTNETLGVSDANHSSTLSLHRQQQIVNAKRRIYANASESSGSDRNRLVVHGNDGYLTVRKYTCIMCKVIPGEPMRRTSQSLNNKQWNRGMCSICGLNST